MRSHYRFRGPRPNEPVKKTERELKKLIWWCSARLGLRALIRAYLQLSIYPDRTDSAYRQGRPMPLGPVSCPTIYGLYSILVHSRRGLSTFRSVRARICELLLFVGSCNY